MTTKVSNVEDNMPPITAIDNGPLVSDPAPYPIAAGKRARISVSEVIRTGFSHMGHASKSA